jgi:MFS superfamily sulfate permease-like transporter
MYIQFLRVLFLVVLIYVAVTEPKQLEFTLAKEWQYIIAVSILITVLFVDVVTGFIFALVLAAVYVKLYNIRLTKSTGTVFDEKALEYITPQNLKDAQSNVVSETAYEKEYVGIKGVYGEAVYGAQGLSEMGPGYERVLEEEN